MSLSQRNWSRRQLRSRPDRKSTRLNSSHLEISYAVFCLKKKKKQPEQSAADSVAGHAAAPLQGAICHDRRDRSRRAPDLEVVSAAHGLRGLTRPRVATD